MRFFSHTHRMSLYRMLLLLCVWTGATRPVSNNDIGFHLRIGEDIVTSMALPVQNPYAYTAHAVEYPDHEWLSQVLLYVVHHTTGSPGLVSVQAFLFAAFIACVMLLFGPHQEAGLLYSCIVWFFAYHALDIRPHMFGWLFSALLLVFLQRRWLRGTLVLLMVWGNMHASVLLGAFVAASFCIWERPHNRNAYGWACACLCAPLLNPYGWHAYGLFFTIKDHVSFVGEWAPFKPNTLHFWGIVAFAATCVYGLLQSHQTPERTRLAQALACVLLVGWGFTASRNPVLMAVYAAPFFVLWFAHASYARWYGWISLVCACALLKTTYTEKNILSFSLNPTQLPVAAVDFLQRHALPQPVFNDYNFGGYFLWKAYPNYKVYVDGRIEVYKGETLNTYLQISSAHEGWEALLNKAKVNTVCIRPERPLAHALLQSKVWDLVYFDYNSVVFVRHSALNASLKILHNISPYGHRNRDNIQQAWEEISYVLEQNPLFFGGYRIASVLQTRMGNKDASQKLLQRYFALKPHTTEP